MIKKVLKFGGTSVGTTDRIQHVASIVKKEQSIGNKDFKNEKNKLLFLREYVENNFDYVGKDFSKKVREFYYDKKSKKGIYGIASQKEREELAEEGIDLLSIPWINKDN